MINPYEKIFRELANNFLADYQTKPNFTNACFFDILIIFQSALIDKLYDNQDYDKMNLEDRCKMAESCGNDLRKLIHTYTNINTKGPHY